MTLNGIFNEPKPHRINFIKENKKKLKQISSMVNRNIKGVKSNLSKSQSSQTDIGRRLHCSSSKLTAEPPSMGKLSRKSTITVFMRDKKNTSSTQLFPTQRPSARSTSATRDQSIQTINPKNYDQLFHKGTIMYPSSRILEEFAEVEKQKAKRLDAHVKKEFFSKNKLKSRTPSKSVTRTSVSDTKKETDDKAKLSKTESKVLTSSSSTQPSPAEIEKSVRQKESDVKVANKPKGKESKMSLNAADIIRKTTEDHMFYSPRSHPQNTEKVTPANRGDSIPTPALKVQKKFNNKKSKKEDDEVLKTVLDPLCPPGHIPLPDQERKKTLHMLRVSYAELIREMNLLPVRTDTLRIRQRKIQLENQLNKIEEGIKVFNKSKVYVKIQE